MNSLKREFTKYDLTPSGQFIIYGFFVVSCALISYVTIDLIGKMWIGLFGIGLPFIVRIFFFKPPSDTNSLWEREWLAFPSPIVIAIFGLVAIGLRLFEAFDFIRWPLFDETVNAYYALGLDQHWSWTPFFFYSQLPPLFIWLLLILYKLTGSFLLALRVEPILISILILPAAYFAARAFFSRSVSFAYLLATGFAFWALFFGRISHQGILLVLWEYLALFCLGHAMRKQGQSRQRWLVMLSVLIGTGFYTYFSWPLVAAWVFGIALYGCREKGTNTLADFACLTLPCLLFLTPLLIKMEEAGYGSYYRLLWSLKGINDWQLQLRNTLGCLTSFLWGNSTRDFYYGPVWGGFFNPPMGAAVLIGMGELVNLRRDPLAKVFWLGLFLFLAPAFVTNTLTDMREIQALPLLTFAAVLGLAKIAQIFTKPRHKINFIVFVIFVSTILDSVHLFKFGHYINSYWASQKTAESEAAYRILEQVQRRSGAGYVLTAFSNDVYTYDQSLAISTYSFNASLNPRLRLERPQWVALITNVHFKPFIEKSFSEAQVTWLSKGTEMNRDNFNGGLMLAVLPLTGKNQPILLNWIAADKQFREISAQVMDLPIEAARRKILEKLSGMLPALSRDPLIRACYWEMVYFNYNWENLYGDHDFSKNFPAALFAIQKAIQEGYPTAYFFNELGGLLCLQKDYNGARKAFLKATQCPVNLTPASENLARVEKIMAQVRPSPIRR